MLGDFPRTELMLRLLRLMFPYMLLICLTAVFMGMLNARGHFFIPAIGSLVMNVVMIASVFLLAPRFGGTLQTQIFALAVGVLVAGTAQAAFQLPTLRAEGFRFHWVTPWGDPTVKQVMRKMIPGTVGVAAFQLNVVLTLGVAYWIDPSMVASFNYAVRLMELPQGVFGISLATYLLPTLSGLAAEKKLDEFRSTLNHGLDHLVFVNLLASLLLFLLAAPIFRLLFERGQFGPADTQGVSFALMCLAPGLVAFSMVNILARSFYALGDTKTPMKISIFCLRAEPGFRDVSGAVLPPGRPGHGQHGQRPVQCLPAVLRAAAEVETAGFGDDRTGDFPDPRGGGAGGVGRVGRQRVVGQACRPCRARAAAGGRLVPMTAAAIRN